MQMRLLCNLTLAALLAAAPALAQQPPPGAPASAPAQPAAAGEKTFSQQDLDRLVAPIALYPDSLLAQILMASTYPLDIVSAARWVKANPGVKDKALEDAMQKQTWDPAVKALAAVPKVLEQMNEQIEWTQQLGDAFLAQQADVMTTVQQLRTKAAAAGNLKSTPEVAVKTEQAEGKTVYIIESPKPEVVYVPTYNPATVYGAWAYPYPPYSMYPPGYAYAPGLAFATGVFVGAAIWGNANWGGNNININTNNYNNFNKTNIQNKDFKHNAENRKGVAAQNNRGASAQNSQSRSQAQGRGGEGRGGAQQQGASNFSGGDRGAGASQMGAGGRGDSGSRGSSPSASTRSSGGGGGFSGAGGSGSSARAASSRGGASRGGGGGGGRGGGRR